MRTNNSYSIEFVGQDCHVYLPFAKKIAREIELNASRANGYATKVMKFNDVEIYVRIRPEQRYIRITREGGSFDMISGYINSGYIYTNSEGKDVVFGYYPSSLQAQMDGLPRGFRDLEDFAYPSGNYPQVLNALTVRSQAGTLCPSLYTGEMKKVVQCILGMKGKQVPFRYDSSLTEGIFKTGNEAPWIISISGSYGVIAMRLPTVRASAAALRNNPSAKAAFDDLGYLPSGDGIPYSELGLRQESEIVKNGTVRYLMTPDKLSEFYSKSPYFYDCGWAFDSKGNRASNTCWIRERDTNLNKAFLYTIQIVGGQDGPISASMSKIEEGYMYVADYRASNFHFPTGIAGIQADTFVMAPTMIGDPDSPDPPPSDQINAPMYCFYVNDSLNVYKQTNSGEEDFQPNLVQIGKSTSGKMSESGTWYITSIGPSTIINSMGISGPGIKGDFWKAYSTITRKKWIHEITEYNTEMHIIVSSSIVRDSYWSYIGQSVRTQTITQTLNNPYNIRTSYTCASPRNRSGLYWASYASSRNQGINEVSGATHGGSLYNLPFTFKYGIEIPDSINLSKSGTPATIKWFGSSLAGGGMPVQQWHYNSLYTTGELSDFTPVGSPAHWVFDGPSTIIENSYSNEDLSEYSYSRVVDEQEHFTKFEFKYISDLGSKEPVDLAFMMQDFPDEDGNLTFPIFSSSSAFLGSEVWVNNMIFGADMLNKVYPYCGFTAKDDEKINDDVEFHSWIGYA